MYNRYIPQSDGTYRRNRMEEPVRESKPYQAAPPEPAVPVSPPCDTSDPPCQKGQPCSHMRPPRPIPPKPPRGASSTGVGGFFRQLLPKDFDTEDLLVVLLLLLMAGDCQEDQNFALLTLAIYLFL